MEDWPYRMVAFAGFFIIAGIAWAVGSRARPNGKTVWGSLVLIWLMGGLTFWLPWSRAGMQWLNDVLVALLSASQKGNVFLFGPLALGPGQALPDGTASVGFVLAMDALVLPAVIFFSALVAGLYHLGIMQWVVRGFARIFYRVMGLSGAEALSASANIFVGVESGLNHPTLPAGHDPFRVVDAVDLHDGHRGQHRVGDLCDRVGGCVSANRRASGFGLHHLHTLRYFDQQVVPARGSDS